MRYFGIGFLVFILLEIFSLIQAASRIGAFGTLALIILSAMAGLFMLRRFGLSGILLAGAVRAQRRTGFRLPAPVAGTLRRGRPAPHQPGFLLHPAGRFTDAAAQRRTAQAKQYTAARRSLAVSHRHVQMETTTLLRATSAR
ncbi:FxsA family protein [Kingella potus]|uniref:FxsA family protein n=1 Tax=Kingella potus TaxID=265175 RepID=UPI001FD2DF4F|nr:FxsA family protein [Kingella potus]UOP01110.1 FxsA family protein [Kingella potus]